MTERAAGLLPGILRQVKQEHASVADPAEVTETQRRYFSGKRNAVRTCKFLEVRIAGRHGSFQGLAVDLSRSGALLRILDPRFAAGDGMDLLMPYTACVWDHFGAGFSLEVPAGELRLSGDVVRVTAYSGRGAHLILLGCRFRRDLSPGECAGLGIASGGDAVPELD